MKLKEIKETLDLCLKLLKVDAETYQRSGREYIRVLNAKQLKTALNLVFKTGMFRDTVLAAMQTAIYEHAADTVSLETSDYNRINDLITNLYLLSQSMSKSLAELVGEVHAHSVYLKMPDLKDFDALAKAANEFNKIFALTVLDPQIGGQVKIESVDNGSIWFEVNLGNIAAVSVIASIAYGAALAFKEFQKGLTEAENRRTKKINNNRLQALQEAQALLLEDFIETQALHVTNKHFPKSGPEKETEVKMAIKMLSEEMHRGAEIQPSLNAPKEVQDEFPNMRNLFLLIDKTLELTNGKSSDKDDKG